MFNKIFDLLPKQMPAMPAFVQAMSPIQKKVVIAVAVAFAALATAVCCYKAYKAIFSPISGVKQFGKYTSSQWKI